MKIEWLVTNITATGSPGRAECAILGMILAGCVFGQFRPCLWSLTAISDIPEGCVLVGHYIARFLYLATDYWTFCSLCIWSLTKLLRIRLKSPFSYIYRTISYLHAIYYRQNLNFSKLFCLEDWKKTGIEPANRPGGVQYYPECQRFTSFFQVFML